MNKIQVKVKCPQCGLNAKAQLKDYKKFIIYKCPGCKENVVCYKDKIEIISEKLIRKLLRKGALVSCGDILFKNPDYKDKEREPITKDDIINLRIMLETETNWEKILEQL